MIMKVLRACSKSLLSSAANNVYLVDPPAVGKMKMNEFVTLWSNEKV